MLLNSELLQVLRERGALATDHFSAAAPVEKQAGEYLGAAGAAPVHNREAYHGLQSALIDMQLASAEVFQIMNTKPRSAVEVFLIVDSLDDRFGDGADTFVGQVLALVSQYFPADGRDLAQGTAMKE